MKKTFVPVFAVLSTLLFAQTAVAQVSAEKGPVRVQILAINDFHGNLQPPTGSSGRISFLNSSGVTQNVEAGGAEYLATHIASMRALNPNTAVVSAGDMIGASPLLSMLFRDEPTIEAFNLMQLDFNAVGNHEFDEGVEELIRMQEGGCHPQDGCLDGDDFTGADFRFLAANVRWKKNGRPIFPAYKIKAFEGAQVGFIGLTLEGTPTLVSPAGVSQLDFLDEADTVNALVPELQKRGIESIIVLVHEGGIQQGSYNGCAGLSGQIVDIVNRMSDAVDVVITGHTHQAYRCQVGSKLVTSASSFGRLVTKIDLSIDRRTGDVISVAADNRIVTRDVPKDPLVTALMDKYEAVLAPLANRVVGSVTADITRTVNAAGESALGDVIADAQLAATAPSAEGGAVVAFVNPSGIRADIFYASTAGEGDGNVTFGEMFNVQPFGTNLVTMTLTGAQIRDLLEQQFPGCFGQTQRRILQVSQGFSYAYSNSATVCEKVIPGSIQLNGAVVDPDASYRVTVNSFIADGGENFTVLLGGTNRLGGVTDSDALEQYFSTSSPVAPGPQNRIILLP